MEVWPCTNQPRESRIYKSNIQIINNHLKFSVPDLKVILVNSRVERNTTRLVQTVRDRFKKFPKVIDGILEAIDAISQEAARILQRPLNDENGSQIVENGGRSATLTPSFTTEAEHHGLQVCYAVIAVCVLYICIVVKTALKLNLPWVH